ncbi:hypothetical protein, partial [Candidatus Agathobaculum pullicola]|uniref:hypothetical protein n=1 Tax=Candidatus Agathobaculum pullicola TaxID=2838426 RepID=UPI003F90BB27
HYGEYLDYIKLLVAAVTQTAPRPFCSAPAAAGRRRMQLRDEFLMSTLRKCTQYRKEGLWTAMF